MHGGTRRCPPPTSELESTWLKLNAEAKTSRLFLQEPKTRLEPLNPLKPKRILQLKLYPHE